MLPRTREGHTPREGCMNVSAAIAEILKREGVEFLIGYPVNPIIEGAAEADIRTIMVRQERIGLHMCDAIGKLSSGDKIGVFVMQHGPGTENAFGGVAQSYGDSCPVVVLRPPGRTVELVRTVHPSSRRGPRACPALLARARLACITCRLPLKAASFRT